MNQEQTFSVDGKTYKVSEFPKEQAGLIEAISLGQQRVSKLQAEIACNQAGVSSMLETLREILKSMTPVEETSAE